MPLTSVEICAGAVVRPWGSRELVNMSPPSKSIPTQSEHCAHQARVERRAGKQTLLQWSRPLS